MIRIEITQAKIGRSMKNFDNMGKGPLIDPTPAP
jgi:hypothetical protein